MANPGAGTKFVSVNLSKSYGQQQQQYHHQYHSSSYGSNRNRSGGAGGGGGGGMVVLSRPRSSQKAAATKLSVPPPLNLPSLRKESEKFDSLGSGAGPTGSGSGTGGVRPSSSGMGWTKPAVIAAPEKDGLLGIGSDLTVDDNSVNHVLEQGPSDSVNEVSKGNSSSLYMPPSVRSVGPAASGLSASYLVPEKATVLRREDFPSLKAALPVVSMSEKKQKDGLNKKQKQVLNEDKGYGQGIGSGLSALVDMRPKLQSRNGSSNGADEKVGEKRGLSVDGMFQKERKQEEYFPEPLPLVRLNPSSHWADDERDTGLGLMDRGIDHGVTKIETYWETDFDFPRPTVLPQKSIHNYVDRRWQRDNEAGKIASSEVAKVDNFGRDTRTSTREVGEGNSWRVSQHLTVNGFGTQEGGNERSGIVVRPSSQNVKSSKESKYVPSFLRDTVQDDTGRRDVGCGHGGRLPLIYTMDCFSGRGSDWNSRERYGNEQSRSRRSDYFQNIPAFKSSFSSGGKGLPVNDPILSIGREKRPSSKNEKSHMDDPFMRDFGASGFDGHDPFAGPLVSLVKRKKDVLKQTDFHDPIRESFEAELERVQKMQEKERKRVIEEQEKAMELARREEEERIRLAREQRERQRRLEEETTEAAWRAEQERLEAIQKAEEQRIAREEEKRRILREEERRKQAAKQKLLELEERIAKRQAEATKFGDNNSSILSDENMSERARATERDASKSADTSEWEDGERMVERIKTSTSTDSSGANRAFDMSSRPLLSRDGFSTFLDRGKNHQPWKQDALDDGDNSLFLSNDQENGHHSPRCDPSVGGRVFSRKETYGGPGCIPSWSNPKGGVPEPHKVDFRHTKGQRWKLSGDGDHFSRSLEMESDFHETLSERFGDGRWSRNHSRDGVYPPYHERIYRNSEADEFYPFGRLRYSMRQPRVLPPPSTNSLQRSSYKIGTGHPGPSTFAENEFQYNDRARSESTMQTIFDSGHQENIVESQTCDFHEESTENETQKTDGKAARCDSQSSLSVSSPPDSPVHLTHDDLDESGDFPVLIGDRKDETFALQVNESAALPADGGKDKLVGGLSCDDEEWPIENDNSFQEQEEYDEDEDAYGEEDEVHDAEDENVNLDREFGDHLKGKGLPDMTDNLVLGFNEGVEVGMPNDEFERSLGNEDENFVTPIVSVGNVKELGSFDGICSEGQALQHVTDSTEVFINKSTRIFREAEKKMQDLVIHPKNAPQSSAASEVMNHMDVCSAGLSSQAQIPSTGQTVLSTVPSVHDQTELPVKLQFGLFSGPSLIPSPVPAIQIGSIQMPLHLHSPIAQSVTHVQSSQPLFQFGQLRYTSPISQGVFPLASQSMSFVQPTVPANFPPNQIGGGSVSVQSGRETSHNLTKCDLLSVSIGGKPDVHSQHLDLLSRSMISKGGNRLPLIETSDDNIKAEQGQGNLSCSSNQNLRTESGFQTEDSSMKNFKNLPTKESGGQPQTVSASLQSAAKGKDSGLGNGQGMITGGRRKRYIFTVKNSGSKSSGQLPEVSRQDPGGFQRRPQRQRMEFQVRENADKRKTVGPMSSNISGINDKSNINSKGVRARNVSRRVTAPNRQAKETFESDGLSSQLVAQETDSGTKVEKGAVREPLRKNMSHPGGDVDTSLQSGIVRIFEQHGIEAPSDDDDFIEVRSKRQMLNDRREQREKEIKAKSRTSKTMWKFRPGSQTAVHSITSSKLSASVCGGDSSNPHTEFVASEGHGLENVEVSAGFGAPIVSQPLPPIGTPVKNDVLTEIRSQAIKTNGIRSLPVLMGGRKNLSSSLKFENKNKVLDNVQTSLGSWANSQIDQQVFETLNGVCVKK